ncbi:MAG: hypothetical protein ACRDD7_12940 [Peptostreptococcaceae bacterium]
MMLYEKLETISLLLGSKDKSERIVNELGKLLKSDVITPRLLARKAKVSIVEATSVLDLLVSKGDLEFFIVIECLNPENIYENEITHYKYFNSIREFNEFSKKAHCNICGCGYEYDFEKAKIGFKRVVK